MKYLINSSELKLFIKTMFLFILYSCSGSKDIIDISRTEIIKNDAKYIKKYGSYPSNSNIEIKKNRYTCTYKDGKLSSIGRQNENKRIGYWYFYDNSMQLNYIVNYGSSKQDTLKNPLAMINQKW